MLIQCQCVCCDEIIGAEIDTFQFRQTGYEKNERPARPKMLWSSDKHVVDIFALFDVIHGQRTCEGYHPHKGKRGNYLAVVCRFEPQSVGNFCASSPRFYNLFSSAQGIVFVNFRKKRFIAEGETNIFKRSIC